MGPLSPTVWAEGLGYVYRATGRGIHGVDLRVDAGEVVALIGPNGSGKSTLARLVSTELSPDTGRLELFGREVGPERSAIRSKIGLVGDTSVHVDELSGRQNAVFFAQAYGLDQQDAATRADSLLEYFGLGAHAQEHVSTYSFGMRRRLLLVEALAHRPTLLIMDEPSVGLDAAGQACLNDAVKAHGGDGGSAVVATNHLGGIAESADRVVFLLGGRVIADASPAQLMSDVQGVTLIEVEVGPEPVSWPGMEGVRLIGTPPILRFESVRGTEPLPSLIRMLLDSRAEIASVSIREPGLADAFEALTGESLPDVAAEGSEVGPGAGRSGTARRLRAGEREEGAYR